MEESSHRALVEKRVESIMWIRDELLGMDELAKPVMGISSWDDAVVVDFGGERLVVSVDGPYAKRLVMKSALIHSATDVAVKGARPLFALDTICGPKEDLKEMIESLKKQALAMNIPLLGGNTMEDESEPKCSLTVAGKLLVKEPIRDCEAKKGDALALIGEPVWGEQDERIEKAKTLFSAWYSILDDGIKINAAKDVTKGGLVSTLYEMAKKSGREYELEKDIPYSQTRNLDNFLVSVPKESFDEIKRICEKKNCPALVIGAVL